MTSPKYQLFDSSLYIRLRQSGVSRIALLPQLAPHKLGDVVASGKTHFEIVPVPQEPPGDALNWYDIDSPGVVDMVGGMFDIFFWMQAA